MPELHARGVELVVELLDAADHVHNLKPEELAALLRETATVLGELLQRDIPRARAAERQ
jgi:predicted ATPase